MKKRALYNILFTTTFCVIVLSLIAITIPAKILASSASISFNTVGENFRIGDKITIELILEADIEPGDFEGYIEYDPDILEYSSGPECITGSEGILKLKDYVVTSDRNSRKYLLTFDAVGRGYSDIMMRGTPEVYEFEAGYLMSVACKTTGVRVLASDTASSDADLVELKISPGVLTPEFSPAIIEYSTELPNNIQRLIISAKSSAEGASVSITGNEQLEVGQNRIVVLVTAEDGTEKKYTIYAIRGETDTTGDNAAAADSQTVTAQSGLMVDEPEEEWSFYAISENDTLYLISKAKYEICKIDSEVIIPDGYVPISIVISGYNVTAYAPSDTPDGDFILLVLKKEGGHTGIYRYDRAEKTIQRYTDNQHQTVDLNSIEEQQIERERVLSESYAESLGTMTIVIAILCGVCALLLIVVIRLFLKCRGIKNDDF